MPSHDLFLSRNVFVAPFVYSCTYSIVEHIRILCFYLKIVVCSRYMIMDIYAILHMYNHIISYVCNSNKQIIAETRQAWESFLVISLPVQDTARPAKTRTLSNMLATSWFSTQHTQHVEVESFTNDKTMQLARLSHRLRYHCRCIIHTQKHMIITEH